MQENLERKKTNKSQVINTRDTGDLYYRGSVLENLIPVEESTEDGSFSTLSLSLPITKTGELFESRLEGGVNRANLKFNNLSTTTSRVSVRNINESERGRKNKSQANKEVRHKDLFYRGSVLANLLPVEVVTKTGSLSTFSLSQTVPRTE
jgi:hypothetical protein